MQVYVMNGRARKTKYLRSALVAVVSAAMLFSLTPAALAAPGDVIDFPDANFKQALIDAGVDTSGDGDITQGEMAAFTSAFSCASGDVSDITGIEHATTLASIDISDNTIRDISALSGFSGIAIDISQNYLDTTSGDDKAVVDTLTANGCTVTDTGQKAIPVSGVSLNKDTLALAPGEDETLVATIDPADAANQTVHWYTDDADIATVSDGSVTAVAPGTVDISAITDDGGHSATCTVTVARAVTGVSLDITSKTICISDTLELTATVAPENATNKDVSWSSSNTGVATVSGGTVTAVTEGSATITTTTDDGGFTAQCALTVTRGTIASETYTIAAGTICFVAPNTSAADFLAEITNEAAYLSVMADGKAYTGDTIGTGMTLRLTVDGAVRDELTILVLGDSNGDGQINIADYTMTRLDILGLNDLPAGIRTVCDIDDNGKIDIADYTMLRLHILDIYPIHGHSPALPYVNDSRIRSFLAIALAQEGKPYVWGDEGPNGFDCSGYAYYCLKTNGYSLYRTTANSYSQFTQWPRVEKDELQPGDLMFYWSDSIPGRIGHIGIYLGNGYHIHASSTYERVIICRIDGWYDRMLAFGRRVYY